MFALITLSENLFSNMQNIYRIKLPMQLFFSQCAEWETKREREEGSKWEGI